MSDLTLRLKDAVTGNEVEATMPDDAQIRELLPAIVEKLQISVAENMKLQNKTQAFEYNENDTLASRKTNENDLCLLTYEPIQGNLR